MKHRTSHIIFAIIATPLLLIVCYCFNNHPYPFGEQTSTLTIIDVAIQQLHKTPIDIDNALFINTGYDLSLVETKHGKETITDRSLLLELLSNIHEDGRYRFVFMDIRLEEGFTTESDTALVRQIIKMGDKILLARHWNYKQKCDFPLIDTVLLSRSAYCDYSSSVFNTAFDRFQYIQSNGVSAPLVMYQLLDSGTIKRHSLLGIPLFYTDNGVLCHNSQFINIPESFSGTRFRPSGRPRFWNLSEDFYGPDAVFDKQDLMNLCKDKIIIIGNFVDDVHDTYLGKQPGAYLHYLAYSNLTKGRHLLPWWYVCFLAIIIGLTFFEIAEQKKLISSIPLIKKAKQKWLSFIISLLSYTTLLSLVSYLSYCIFQKTVGIFIPVLVFTVCDMIFKYKNYE